MSPFSTALPKILSRRGEENILGKRVRMSILIRILPQPLDPGDLHHPFRKVDVQDDLPDRGQRDLSPFPFDYIDIMSSRGKDLPHLPDPFAFPRLNLDSQEVGPVIFSLFYTR